MTLRAGAARAIITPQDGLTMGGYAAREGSARGRDSDLTLSVLVLEDGRTRAAVLAFDLLFVQEPDASALREAVGRALRIPAAHVTLNCSHTHCGPSSEGL